MKRFAAPPDTDLEPHRPNVVAAAVGMESIERVTATVSLVILGVTRDGRLSHAAVEYQHFRDGGDVERRQATHQHQIGGLGVRRIDAYDRQVPTYQDQYWRRTPRMTQRRNPRQSLIS